jgi:DNA-binding transcriptional LysR family regulator
VCAAPGVLAKLGTPKSVDALSSLPCVILGGTPSRWQFETESGSTVVVVDGRVRSNNILALRDAALAGLGFVQLPRWLVVDDLRKRRLVQVLASAKIPPVTVLGIVHADARRSNVLRLTQDFLAAALPPSLAGRPPSRG